MEHNVSTAPDQELAFAENTNTGRYKSTLPHLYTYTHIHVHVYIGISVKFSYKLRIFPMSIILSHFLCSLCFQRHILFLGVWKIHTLEFYSLGNYSSR